MKLLYPNMEDIAHQVSKADEFSFDIECFAPGEGAGKLEHLDPFKTQIVGISLATKHNAWYIPFGVDPKTNKKYAPFLEFKRIFKDIFLDKDKRGVAWSCKFDYKILTFNDLQIDNELVDPMIASFLCDENFPHGLKATTARELGILQTKITEVWDNPYSQEFFDYGRDDAIYTLRLWKEVFEPRLAEEGMEKPFWAFEMPCVKIAAEMEMNGILMDVAYINDYVIKATGQLKKIEEDLFNMADKEFNINSPKQIGAIMFGDAVTGEPGLGLPTSCTSKGKPIGKAGIRYWKTNEAVLQRLALLKIPEAEFPRLILKYRKITKRISTYCRPYLDKYTKTGDGRIHCSFNTIGTETGRWCVAKGTPVEVLRDANAFPKGIPIEDVKAGDLAYTYDDNLQLTLKKVKWVGKTGNKPVVRVHWRGQGRKHTGYVDLTEDHEVRLTTGIYVQAKNLVPGDSILALHRSKDKDGYQRMWATNEGEIQREHRWVYEKIHGGIPWGTYVHHEDENRSNNKLDNLKAMPVFDHQSMHSKKVAHARSLPTKLAQRYVGKNYYKFKELQEYFGFVNPYNHTVVKVERLPGTVDVYDMEVEDTHNFIAGELCVHNCSRNPNMQNLPRASKEFSLRRAVIAEEGFYILSSDFSQLEMRLMAEVSMDPVLIEIYKRNGKCDCATWKASYAKDPEEPRCRHVDVHTRTSEDAKISRQDAKPLNFGAIYGMGWKALIAQVFKFTGGTRIISEAQSKHMLRSFFNTYRNVKRYHNWVNERCIDRGWIKTLLGRKRRIFHVDKSDWRSKGAAFRELTNASVQGSAADIVMLALRNVARERDARAKEDPRYAQCKFISMVHDEMIMEVPIEIAKEMKEMVVYEMNNCVKLKHVPLASNCGIGPSWGDAH